MKEKQKAKTRGNTETITSTAQIPQIAIVGMASVFPESRNLNEYWNTIISKKDCIKDIEDMNPDTYWKKGDFYSENLRERDKTYGFKAGFVPTIEFDPIEFKIPPKILESISTVQLFSLYTAKQAVEDAGLLNPEKADIYKEKTGVILGVGGIGNTGFLLGLRNQTVHIEKIMANAGIPTKLIDDVSEKFRSLSAEWQEDSFPGFLGNVVSGRIANYFDFGGTNYSVDAACGSSLGAIKAAVNEIIEGSCDVVVTGGTNIDSSIFSFMCFSKTPALSPTGTTSPYDADSDGMMMGDGIGMLVLKRLDLAERDGDRIYAVIKGVAASSDGKAKSLFAPRYEGQVMALKRAYQKSGLTPKDVQLIEGHGTSTKAGDYTEFKALSDVYKENGVPLQSVALGSVKSQIGHTRTAAGSASMIKAALALHHKVLPPTINVKKPNPQFGVETSPLYINTEPRPWIKFGDKPRCAAVSSFGFGGTNFHVVLEEYKDDNDKEYRMSAVPNIIIIHDSTPKALTEKCKLLLDKWKSEFGENDYSDYIQSTKDEVIPESHARVGFAACSIDQACEFLDITLIQLKNKSGESWEHPKGVYYKPFAKNLKGKVVALFPGQGSQYVNMGTKIAQNYPEMRDIFNKANKVTSEKGLVPISSVVYPVPVFDQGKAEEQEKELIRTQHAQPAIGTVSAGMYKLLLKAGFEPNYVVGHSFGELTALWAAGVIDDSQLIELAAVRGMAMSTTPQEGQDLGAMVAISENIEEVEKIVANYSDVQIANYNSPTQIVVSGPTETIQKLHNDLKSQGKRSSLLPVAAAFHSPLVKHAQEPFAKKLQSMSLNTPKLPVYANITGDVYPSDIGDIKTTLSSQITSSVKFYQSINSIYDKGGYLFVEIGPKGVLSKLIGSILKDKDHAVVSVNPNASKDDELQLRQAIAKLKVEGLELKDFDNYQLPIPKKKPNKMSVYLDGGNYYSKEVTERRNKALYDEDKGIFESIINERVKEIEKRIEKEIKEKYEAKRSPEPVQPIELRPNTNVNHNLVDSNTKSDKDINDTQILQNKEKVINLSTSDSNGLNLVNAYLEAQNAMNDVHKQFQDNEQKYLELLNNLINKQVEIINTHSGSPQFKDILETIGHSVSLLEKNQEVYHANHDQYFRNQLSLMGFNKDEANIRVVKEVHSKAEPIMIPKYEPQVQKPIVTALADKKIEPVKITATVVEAPVLKPIVVSNAKAEEKPVVISVNEKEAEEIKTGSFDSESFKSKLIGVVSEKTGYPTDMIDIDMDLEADMGIDSIKRVEILGAMAGDFPTMEADDVEAFGVEEFKTLRKIIQYVEKLANSTSAKGQTSTQAQVAASGASVAVMEPPKTMEITQASSGKFDPEAFKDKLIGVVSEKTGYPADMINIDMDLEADMGIDSIKRVEILGAMAGDFPTMEADDVEAFGVEEFKTLRKIIEYVGRLAENDLKKKA